MKQLKLSCNITVAFLQNSEMLQMFSPSLGLCSYWPSGAPRGQVVTRFPGTRQEEEKQNKPERAVTACGLH